LSHRPMLPILILCAGTPLLHGQGIVEHGIIDGKTAAGAAGAGASVLGVLSKMGNTTEKAAKTGGTPAAPPPRAVQADDIEAPRPPSSPAPAAAPVSFSAVTEGMDRAEVLKLFGKPSMSVSGMDARALTETFWYQTATESVTIVLHDGKVFSISRVEKLTAK
jgi:hypothetical protein